MKSSREILIKITLEYNCILNRWVKVKHYVYC